LLGHLTAPREDDDALAERGRDLLAERRVERPERRAVRRGPERREVGVGGEQVVELEVVVREDRREVADRFLGLAELRLGDRAQVVRVEVIRIGVDRRRGRVADRRPVLGLVRGAGLLVAVGALAVLVVEPADLVDAERRHGQRRDRRPAAAAAAGSGLALVALAARSRERGRDEHVHDRAFHRGRAYSARSRATVVAWRSSTSHRARPGS
jgi:hypothetical protein